MTLVVIFVFIIVLIPACSVHPSTVAQINSPYGGGELAVQLDPEANSGAIDSAIPETDATSVITPQDGPSLLASRCTQCHLAMQYEQIKKSRTAWEKTLMQMEAMGLQLSDTERIVLLDYLADVDDP
jgi:hypothetical protein